LRKFVPVNKKYAMKDFFKFMLASMLGFFLMILIISFISFGILAAIIAATTSKEITIPSNSVLQIRLDNPVVDRTPKMPLFIDLGSFGKTIGLNDILKNLKKAKKDEKIRGIFLDLSATPSGISTLDEIREALLDFKESGKFIIAYGEIYTQPAYYLASVADRVYLHPEGTLMFKGINAEMFFLKGTLDKLDVKMQVIRHGKYKAAMEPFFLDKMSPENRQQITALISQTWNRMLEGISASRNIPVPELNALADSLITLQPEAVLQRRLADGLLFRDQLLDSLKKMLDLSGKKEISFVTIENYTSVPESGSVKPGVKDKIAVIYAVGTIGSGEGDDRNIGSDRIGSAIRSAREDDRVKAIVFRINSPGGSALASDVIWREINLAVASKPVVASLGDVAASGGYYIACPATRILADPTTITGSIGVFGAIPNMKGLFNNKLGITFDKAKTNANSDFIPVTEPISAYQTAVFQNEIERIYDTFISHVADGRKMSRSKVDSIGQGRVWNARDAKAIGLIDDFGGLEQAILEAANLANISEYRVIALPRQKGPIEQIMEQLMGNAKSGLLEKELGEDYRYWQYLKEVREIKGVQARMPFEIILN